MKHRPDHAATSHEPGSKADHKADHERWVVDGLEDSPTGKVARVELPDGSTRDVDVKHLPGGIKEGDILHVKDGPDGIAAQIQAPATAQAKAAAQDKLQALNKAGDAAGQEITL